MGSLIIGYRQDIFNMSNNELGYFFKSLYLDGGLELSSNITLIKMETIFILKGI